MSSGTLSPSFTPSGVSYTATVSNATTTVTVTPTVAESNATVKINGTAVASGSASTPISLSVGANPITVVVTAQDGTTTKSYTVSVTRASSTDATLSNLTLSSGTLSPGFAPGTLSYIASVTNATTSLTVTPTVTDSTATVKVNGTAVTSGSASGSISLSVGANPITVRVTAQDGTTIKDYTITVTRASTDATLASLTLSSGTLSPSFTPSGVSYTATVSNATTSVTVTPTVAESNATVKVNGTAVASGSVSGSISLAVGPNTITVRVTAQDGTTVKDYTITVTRASTDATLASLTLSSGTLSPSFTPSGVSYTATVSNATTSVTVTPTVAESNATVKVNGTAVASGSVSGSISLAVGPNTITVRVTAQDGTTVKDYAVTVTRASTDATLAALTLSSGTLSPSFTPSGVSYTATVSNATTTVTVTPTVAESNATVTVNGNSVTSGNASGSITLAVGLNTITVRVTAQDGTTIKDYTIAVTRAASTDATLAALTLSSGTLSPSFTPSGVSYTATVSNATTTVTVTPTVAESNATVTVNGNSVTSGNASGSITLAVGLNTITVRVTAQDGTTIKVYTIAVTRAASTDATLAALGLSSGTLSPGFSAGQLSYTASVANSVSTLTVTPTVAETNATVTVNGSPVTSGSASSGITLAVGPNTITVRVTAQDGTTIKVYTVDVTRAAPAASTDATLAALSLSSGTLSPGFSAGQLSYNASVANSVTTLTVTPTVADTNATVTVNGSPVTSGSASSGITLAVGPNTITVRVTAQDGTTIKDYTVDVTRAAPAVSSDATLAALGLSSGTLSPGFSAGQLSYTASVANSVSTLTVTPTVADTNATVTVNGSPVTSGSASSGITLAVGPNTITVRVTAQDGTTIKDYTVDVTRAAPAVSSDATLAALGLSSGTLSPGFSAGQLSYTASVANSVSTLTVTPTVADTNATVTVNGSPVTSGSASSGITLAVGPNTITVRVTAQDGTTIKVYTVDVTRAAPAASTDATLAALGLSSGTLSPGFSAGQLSYTASVANSVTTLTVTPTVAETSATVTVNGNGVTSGNASGSISLAVGLNTITVRVTAQDGTTIKVYTVDVTRAAPAVSSDATLAALTLSTGTLSPSFASGTLSYTASVANSVSTLTVTPTVAETSATVTVNGSPVASGSASSAITLAVGANAITVDVTAQDGSTKVSYTVIVTRAAPASIVFSPASGPLSKGSVGANYSQTLTPSGGSAPYTFAVTGNVLPAGLTLDTSTGVIRGTPSVAGEYAFTVTVTDANAQTASVNYQLSIAAAPANLVFSPAGGALSEAMAGEDYRQEIAAKGGTGTLIYSVGSGTLPKGLVLNVSTGTLTGPLETKTEGDYSFSISATDTGGATATANYTLKVAPRAVTAPNKEVTVAAGSTPPDVYLNRGATGGPFFSAEIVVVEPANAGTARIVQGQLAQAASSFIPVGWYLQFTPNPSYSGQVKVNYRLSSTLGLSNTGVVTYNLGYDAGVVAQDIDALVHGFVRSRQSLIAGSLHVPGLLERRRLDSATDPVTTVVLPSAEGLSMGFSTSLAQMEAARNHADGIEGGADTRFNIWIDGIIALHNRKDNGSQWGSFGMLSLGADYLLTDKALLGVSLHYDRMTDPTDNDAKLTGNGWLVGPYASFELLKGVFWDTSVLYGGSSNAIDTRFWDGRFDTTRWIVDTKLKGQWDIGDATVLTPKFRTIYLSETVKDYGVSNNQGDFLGLKGFTEEQLRVSAGADLARSFTLADGSVLTPKVGANVGFSGLNGAGAFGSISGGLSLVTENQWGMEANILFNIEGDGDKSTAARVRVSKKF
ncbi:cadherin-like beta sandwich domain-containing protein [Allorhizobium terrae]|uniref:cadherin-like beta sandwich domain-containing protein n=1 Tax=Allorhizobium terrae TaxID=1848972 RepID=UPI00167C6DFC